MINIAEIIMNHGTDPSVMNRVFLQYRDDSDVMNTITYKEFYRQSLIYGNMLLRCKISMGMSLNSRFHVGVFMQNIPAFFFLLGGCAYTNSTLVGVNNAQVGEKLAFDINNIDMHVLFVDHAPQPGTDGTFLDTVIKAKEIFGFSSLPEDRIFATDIPKDKSHAAIRTISSLLRLSENTLSDFQPAALDPLSPAVIIFTSGTTGAPKGIEVTWQKLYDTGLNTTKILSYTKDDVGYICMPVNHSNSLYLNIMPALLNGSKLFLRRRFSVRSFVKDIEDSGATIWNCVGDPVQYVINHLHSTIGSHADFSGLPLRTVISTGTNAANRAVFTGLFGLDIFTEVYGSTEAGAITAVDSGTPDFSVGRLLKDIRIMSESTGRLCSPALVDESGKIKNLGDSAGEIVVSQSSLGASAFTGYYRLKEESAKKLISIDGEDFYRMGDLGAIVEISGIKYLVFLGRTGDWIRFKGENWTPVDAEKVIGKYDGVRNAGIIGVPQSKGREDDPMYIIEVETPSAFQIDRFLAFCAGSLPHYMQPRFIRVVRIVPLTETMKLIKSVLKSEFYCRSEIQDTLDEDIIYVIENGSARRFQYPDYLREISLFTDPTNQDTLKAYTKRSDLF